MWRERARWQNRQGQTSKLVMSVGAMLHFCIRRESKFIHKGSASQALIYRQQTAANLNNSGFVKQFTAKLMLSP